MSEVIFALAYFTAIKTLDDATALLRKDVRAQWNLIKPALEGMDRAQVKAKLIFGCAAAYGLTVRKGREGLTFSVPDSAAERKLNRVLAKLFPEVTEYVPTAEMSKTVAAFVAACEWIGDDGVDYTAEAIKYTLNTYLAEQAAAKKAAAK